MVRDEGPPSSGQATSGCFPPYYEHRDRPDPYISSDSPQLGKALNKCPFPLVVWSADEGVLRLANDAAAQLAGVSLDHLVGRRLVDLLLPSADVERSMQAISSGSLIGIQSERVFVKDDGCQIPVWVWTRAVECDGRRGGVSLVMPSAEIGRLGRDPVTPWRELVPIAVGVAGDRWIIRSISRDVVNVLGFEVDQVVGRSLTDLVFEEDRARLTALGGSPPHSAFAANGVRMTHNGEGSVRVCLLVAPLSHAERGQSCFAMIGPVPSQWAMADRVAELELRLRRIGSELRAAGVLDNVYDLLAPSHQPQLAELTTRQWEILNLLLRGLRVPAIAGQLFLSPSTVRNHLATIFRRFGVHSQSELLEFLRRSQGGHD